MNGKPIVKDYYDKNTADKTPELCLFYNLALNRMNQLIAFYEGKKAFSLEKRYEIPKKKPNPFKRETYLQLKIYLWKEDVSDSFARVEDEEVELIEETLSKLVDVRNFQSHFYHDSRALKGFSKELQNHMEVLLQSAKSNLIARQPHFEEYFKTLQFDSNSYTDHHGQERTDTYDHFDYFKDGTLQPEGKNFFLSFFLLGGEMNRFLRQRKRCKNSSGEKYQVKNKLLTYYCHRDGSNRFFLHAREKERDADEKLRRQFNSILNYLKAKPVVTTKFLPSPKAYELKSKEEMDARREARGTNNEEQAEEPIIPRRSSKFMNLTIRYFMDRKALGHKDQYSIYWHVKTHEHYEVEKPGSEENHSYMKVKEDWKHEFEAGCFPIVKNNHILFKINNEGHQYQVNERELKNWLTFLLEPKYKQVGLDETIEKLKAYGEQYVAAMQELVGTNDITFTIYPLVFGQDGSERYCLTKAHYKILEQKSFDPEEYREIIRKRLKSNIQKLDDKLAAQDTLRRHDKMRQILQAYHWFAVGNTKLSPAEINDLSKYVYLAGSDKLSKSAHESIIKDLKGKLEKANAEVAKMIIHAKSLDDVFEKIMKKRLEHVESKLRKLPNESLENLHQLASKLAINLPGIDEQRGDKDRLKELKDTILAQPVLVPNGFFKRTFDPDGKNSPSTTVKKNRKWTSLLLKDHYLLQNQDEFINQNELVNADDMVPVEILQLVDDQYDQHFNVFSQQAGQKFADFVTMFTSSGREHDEQHRKQITNAINLYKKLKETLVHDTLLAQVLYQYHKLKLPIDERAIDKNLVNIAELYDALFEWKIDQRYSIKLKYKQLDDLAATWDRGKLRKLAQNQNYWNEGRLAELQPDDNNDKNEVGLSTIMTLFNDVYHDSLRYIETVLYVEELLIRKRESDIKRLKQESRKPHTKGFSRIEPEVLFKKIADEKDVIEFKELRNKAFHTDIPSAEQSYEKTGKKLSHMAGLRNSPYAT